MQDVELKEIWETYNRKLAKAEVLNLQSWALNIRCFETMQHQLAERKLKSLSRFNLWAVLLGFAWIAFLLLLVWINQFQNIFFSLSISCIAVISLYVTASYIRNNILIAKVRYDTPVTDTQKQLAKLQSATFHTTAIAWLQLPFYTTWFWSSSWIQEPGLSFWLIAFPITLLFAFLAIFLYRNIHAANMQKKWVKTLMMAGPEYRNVAAAMVFLEEIEAFVKDRG
jgi:glucan phosphoethanolaminetransferase (alkaline phosphatase superfamily)